jgi:2-iminobutanoate/2-iminopropanoate deaminase
MKITLSMALLTAVGALFSTQITYFRDGEIIGPYTPAIKAGRTLYISGQIALTPGQTDLGSLDFEAETHQVMENLTGLLKKSGYDTTDLVQCTVYLKDIRVFPTFNRIYGEYFKNGKAPTRTTVEVSNLPRNAKIEISAIAYK